MNYNNLYKQHQKVWGQGPNKLLQMVWKKAEPGSCFLDLGCGQGRDSLFMAKQGFQVTAVDKSIEGINNLKQLAKENNFEKIQVICQDIKDFEIEKDKYSIINVFNASQFLKKEDALKIIKALKENLKINGFIIIEGFTAKDPLFKEGRGFFKPKELQNLFSDFKIILYKEAIIDDAGHPGFEQPHQHGVVRLIAKKVKSRRPKHKC